MSNLRQQVAYGVYLPRQDDAASRGKMARSGSESTVVTLNMHHGMI